ncbi:MAG: glutamate synthase central domain-containing protein, partial [Acidobacteriota bacterium]
MTTPFDDSDPAQPSSIDTAVGLWDGRERGACGIGFVADLQRRPGRRVLDLALEALTNLAHRGGIAADGLTSDGTGLTTCIPWALLRRELADGGAESIVERDDADLALGMLFVPRGADDAGHRLVDEAFAASGLSILARRAVPIERGVLGEQALASLPAIWQIVVERPADVERGAAFERRLYLARKRLERQARRAVANPADAPIVVSLSHRTVVYKSMAPATELASFYPDLAAPAYTTPIALFHQRFSTNTRPAWHLAQPFRLLAHNGEINTIQGNREWMSTREPQLSSELWGGELAEVLPVLDPRGSDSAMLDQMLEFLVLSGRDPLHAMAMAMPPALDDTVSEDLRAFYDYHATLLEPWDGPAAVVLTDGRIAAAGLDRNGLRPQRYWRTDDGLVIVGSEAGMCPLPASAVVEKGRLGPGQLMAVDLHTGRFLTNAEAKADLAGRQPWKTWLDARTIQPPVDAGPASVRTALADLDEVTRQRRQILFGYTKEAIERILDPMLDGALPVGSMGNDAPLAVLSRQPQLLYSYFK